MGKWFNTKIESVCRIVKGEQLNRLQLESSGDYPCINGGIEPSGYTNKWNREENSITISEGGNSCGYVGFQKSKFWSGGHCYTLNDLSGEVERDFLYYALKGRESLIMNLRVGSGLPNIQQKSIREFEFLLPEDKIEQKRISEILGSIDKAISDTEILVAKNQRILTGLLQDLLVKGIDEKGNIRKKSTHKFTLKNEIEVPLEWDVKSLSSLTREKITYGIVQAGPDIPNGVPYIRTGDMAGDSLTSVGLLRTSDEIASRFLRSRVEKDDIVFALRATIGKVLQVPTELEGANLTQGTARVAPNKNLIISSFLLWALRMDYFKNQILHAQKGTTFFEVSLGDLRTMRVAFPKNITEQNRITEIINNEEEFIQSYKSNLNKLYSLKTGLMQDLLSGKVRVN